MTNKIGNGKLGGLIEYLDSLVEKGRARRGVVAPLKVAITQIFQTVEGDGWVDIDARDVNVNDYWIRFQNIAMDKYTTASYEAYRSRALRAISWYDNFLKNPGWVPTISERRVPIKANTNLKAESKKMIDTKTTQPAEPESRNSSIEDALDSLSAKQDRLVAFPFPMSNGELATLYLPASICQEDAERLANFISALVVRKKKGGDM